MWASSAGTVHRTLALGHGYSRHCKSKALGATLRCLISGVRRPIMDGKVIVVTGALGALGSVVVEEALARRARIASVDHAPTQVPATADLYELGGVDLTDAAQARKAIDAAASHFGKIDALINIAGGFAFETVADGDPKTWQRMYALNVATALAAELKGNITVNAVLPSTIDTAANRASMPKADFAKWVRPKELADVILFLASDAASAVTGALLPVNGRV